MTIFFIFNVISKLMSSLKLHTHIITTVTVYLGCLLHYLYCLLLQYLLSFHVVFVFNSVLKHTSSLEKFYFVLLYIYNVIYIIYIYITDSMSSITTVKDS